MLELEDTLEGAYNRFDSYIDSKKQFKNIFISLPSDYNKMGPYIEFITYIRQREVETSTDASPIIVMCKDEPPIEITDLAD